MKILIADDEIDLTNVLSTILKKDNYTVDIVHDGKEALDYLKFGNYDALILDVMMPIIDGYTVLKKMRENNIKTPVLMLTAKSETDDKVYGLDLGADDYLAKPFDVKELLARLRVLIRRNNSQASNILSFEDIKLDLSSFTLSNNEKSINLTNKEFQIMELLMSKPGKIVSPEIILNKVWAFDAEVDLPIIWVFISNLRKKIQQLSSTVELKSNRGAGYYLAKKNV